MPSTKSQKSSAKSKKSSPPKSTKAVAQKSKSKLLQRFGKRKSKKGKANPKQSKLMGSFRIFGRSILNLSDHWPQFLKILLIYLLLNLVFVSGFNNLSSGSELRADANGIFHGSTSHVTAATSFFSSLAGSSSSSGSDASSTYQLLFVLVFSLVIIWALRVELSARKLKVSDAFYKGLYPLVPALLIVMLIAVELIPFLAGTYVYGTVMTNGLSANLFQDILWLALLVVLAAISMYFITSSLFAFYIVTLPNMKPMEALRSARKLVKHRRLLILRKILFLPVCLFIIGFFILVPFADVLSGATYWLYLLLISMALFVWHSYMYTLYRELL